MDRPLPAYPRGPLSRRTFLAGSLAAGQAAGGQDAAADAGPGKVRQPARRVIFVLMSGGPSQLETFDPKTGAPTGGPFGSIATQTPGLRFCEYLPRLASMSDQFAVVRSVTGPAPGGDHLADLRYTLTGHYSRSRFAVQRPSFGSGAGPSANAFRAAE